jgi:hypothetical protein
MSCNDCNGYGKIILRYIYAIGKYPSFTWERCTKCTKNYFDVLDMEKSNPTKNLRRIKHG